MKSAGSGIGWVFVAHTMARVSGRKGSACGRGHPKRPVRSGRADLPGPPRSPAGIFCRLHRSVMIVPLSSVPGDAFPLQDPIRHITDFSIALPYRRVTVEEEYSVMYFS